MKTFFNTLFLTLFLAFTITAQTVKLSDYCTLNDANDDSACFQTAVNDLRYGGTIIVDGGVVLQGMVSFVDVNYANNSFLIKGDKNAIIKPDYAGIIFYSGTQNQLVFEDILFVGDGVQVNNDANYVIYFGGGPQSRISRCEFYGVKAAYSLIYGTNTDVVISNTIFHGASSTVGTLEIYNARGLTVRDTEFIDYGILSGTYHSKTPQGVGTWIKATATSQATANATANRGVILENVRFDEGALKTAIFQNLKYVDAKSVMVNVVGVTNGAGFVFDNIRLGTVKNSFFGYSGNARPAFVLTNNSKVNVEGLTLGVSVFDGTADGTSSLNISDCDGC